MGTATLNQEQSRELKIGRFRQRLRESLLAYLLVAPATIVMLTFGIYPVVLALWESLKSGSPITNRYVGLDNYTRGAGGLIYVACVLLAVVLCFLAAKSWRRARQHQQMHPADQSTLWIYLIPSFIFTLGFTWLLFLFVTEYLQLGLMLIGAALIAIATGSYWALRQRTQGAVGFYVGTTILTIMLTVWAILLVRYAYNQMEEDAQEARDVAQLLLRTEVANAAPNLPREDTVVANVALDGEVPLKATIGETTYDAFLSPQAYQSVSLESLTETSLTFSNNQKIQVLMPLPIGLGFEPAPYTTEATLELEGGGILGGGDSLEARVLLSENSEVLVPYDIYAAQDVGQAVITRGGYTPPVRRTLGTAFGVFLSIGLIYAIGVYRQHPVVETNARLSYGLALARILLAIVGIGLLVYLLISVQLYREAANGLESLTEEQFGRAYEFATGAPPRGNLQASALAADLLFAPQLILIATGAFLIGMAYLLWTSAQKRETNLGLSGGIALALLLMIGGWLCISELPNALMKAGAPAIEVRDALIRTVIYSAVSVPTQLGVGLLLAYFMFYEVRIGKGFFRLIYFMPYIAPQIATATVFTVIFSLEAGGLANQFLDIFGIETQKWLLEPNGLVRIIYKELFNGNPNNIPAALEGPSMALTTVILFNIWVYSGYYSVIFLAGLGSIPGELYEAAKVDGAGRWSAFRNITIPLLSPVTFFLSMLGIIGTFSSFGSVYVLRSGAIGDEVDTLTIRIFQVFYTQNDPGYATALAFILFSVILILTLIQNQLSRDRVFYG